MFNVASNRPFFQLESQSLSQAMLHLQFLRHALLVLHGQLLDDRSWRKLFHNLREPTAIWFSIDSIDTPSGCLNGY